MSQEHLDYEVALDQISDLKALEAELYRRLVAKTEAEIFHGTLRRTPCTICNRVQHLTPKYRSLKDHTELEWRCPAHINVALKGEM